MNHTARCTCFQHLCLLEDGCGLQPKHIKVTKQIVQLVGNKLVCIGQLNVKCTVLMYTERLTF
jgi:hypothetical protein